MPVRPKDSRLIGYSRVKPRPLRLPKARPIPEGLRIAEDQDGSRLSYNPPASSPNPLITPTPFLPAHLRQYKREEEIKVLPPPLSRKRKTKELNEEQIEEVKQLRAQGLPVAELARKFSVSKLFISLIAPLAKSEREKLDKEAEKSKAKWSERKQLYGQLRQLRRASWGL